MWVADPGFMHKLEAIPDDVLYSIVNAQDDQTAEKLYLEYFGEPCPLYIGD